MNMNYEEAKRLMKTARDKDKGKPLDKANTRLYEVNDSAHLYPVYEIRLHGHPIIRMINTETSYVYELSSCGYHTVTTKQRLNHYTPFSVYQKNREWFLVLCGWNEKGQDVTDTYEFTDGMEIVEPRTNLCMYHVYVNRKPVEAVRND